MSIKKLYPFSNVHKKTIIDFQNNKMNFLLGAVRSGKTYLANLLFLKYIKNRSGKILLTGNTSDSIKKNVISDFESLLNCKINFKSNNFGQYFEIDSQGYENLIFYVVGAGKKNSHTKIQGLELLFWYADEAATYDEDFFQMMITRLSREDSKAIFTLNPEGPSHWLKKFLDDNTNKENTKYLKGYISTNTFTLLDNYALPKDYIKQIQNSLSGHMYQRLVLGKWSAGEGLVYSVDKLNYINLKDIKEEILRNKQNFKFTIGVDIGSIHATAFILVAKNTKTNKYYVLKEYYKTKIAPSILAKDLVSFYEECKKEFDIYNSIEIKYDHAAAYFFTEFQITTNHNILLSKAKKNVMDGIMNIERYILNNSLFIVNDCINLKNEFLSYSWDSKKNNEVIKIKDDAIDALRYAIFSNEYQSSSY